MIRNIILDFGSVLVDWNPERLYGPYFNDDAKMRYFLTEICPHAWNAQADAGRSTAEITEERVAVHPEWEKEIRMYFGQWIKMMGEQIPGMQELVEELKNRGYRLYGLTNWSAETFPLVKDNYPVFRLLDGIVVSGEEKIAKPDPGIFSILLQRYGLKPEECLFIDDNPKNVSTGESLGIRGLVFTSAAALRSRLAEVLPE
ncbi:MAG TPA: HAD family phosphatase [Candidatus Cryptobacteroides excrementigallinarum]|nr:HAD family phosphatase [Candidatus Cryptobacteroides excrementigallinarum]